MFSYFFGFFSHSVRFYRILSNYLRNLPDSFEFFRNIADSTGFFRILPDYWEFYRIPLHAFVFFRILSKSLWFYRSLSDLFRTWLNSPICLRLYRILLNCFRILSEFLTLFDYSRFSRIIWEFGSILLYFFIFQILSDSLGFAGILPEFCEFSRILLDFFLPYSFVVLPILYVCFVLFRFLSELWIFSDSSWFFRIDPLRRSSDSFGFS